MSWRTNRFVIGLRNFGRAVGLNRLLSGRREGRAYEDRFQQAMLGGIRAGDVVWDVGANVGLYACRFAELAGVQGKVFAYEPSPTNLERLNASVSVVPNVSVIPCGLGDAEKIVSFEQGTDDLGATSRVVDSGKGTSGPTLEIKIARGDDLVTAGIAAPPNVIKIDTEGYELDVLEGLERTLHSSSLRMLCIEVHFQLLEQRGLATAPAQIERRLEDAGFSVSWPDASHIIALRP